MLPDLLERIRQCRQCEANLVLGPRPIVQASAQSRVLIIGQAPGRRVHQSGIPWDDLSGDRLREWMQISREDFYNPEMVAMMPMGFCYPGTGPRGDLPPRRECEPLWHGQLLALVSKVEVTLLVGNYAQRHYLRDRGHGSLTKNVKAWAAYMPITFPLPHPSPRNNRWFKSNPWFSEELLPELRRTVRRALATTS